MPTKNPRVSASLDKPIYTWLRKKAKAEGVSLSLLIRDLLKGAYEREEDLYWEKEANLRMVSFNIKDAVSHKVAWNSDIDV